MTAPRIVVIGLGATGSAALHHLARRGVHAIGVEQFDIGHDRGSSHGPTRIFRLAHFENPSYVALMRSAHVLWRELETSTNLKLLHTTGIVEIGPAQSGLVYGTITASRDHNLRYETMDAATLMRRYPSYRMPDDFIAVWQQDGGFIEAEAAIAAQLRLSTDAGAQVRTNEKVLAVKPSRQGVSIKTDRDLIEADGAIIAAGPWLGALLPQLRLPMRVTRQVVCWFEPNGVAQFAADRFPVFLLETQYGLHYGFPAYGSRGVKVAKHHHLDEVVTPETCERNVSARDVAAVRAPLSQYLPAADGRLFDAQTCLYTMTPDETFIIDRMPEFSHVVIASPCCGHGFKFSPVIGEIVADLATTGSTAHDISRFRLSRFG